MAQKPVAQYFLGDIRFPIEEREKVVIVLMKYGFRPERVGFGRPGECIIRNADDPWGGVPTIRDALHAEGLLFPEERYSAQG
jgi:hypothetical protein